MDGSSLARLQAFCAVRYHLSKREEQCVFQKKAVVRSRGILQAVAGRVSWSSTVAQGHSMAAWYFIDVNLDVML
jgi:hypothetical protein